MRDKYQIGDFVLVEMLVTVIVNDSIKLMRPDATDELDSSFWIDEGDVICKQTPSGHGGAKE